MNHLRVIGASIIVGGITLSILLSSAPNAYPYLGFIDFGLVVTLLGGIVLAVDMFSKGMRYLHGTGLSLVVVGWTIFAAGALVSFTGFLLTNQVMCSCPESGPCNCGVPLYNVIMYGGMFATLVGLASVVGGSIVSRLSKGAVVRLAGRNAQEPVSITRALCCPKHSGGLARLFLPSWMSLEPW